MVCLRGLCVSVCGVDDVLVWVVRVACLSGWLGWHASVGGMLAWVARVEC